eukprot:6201891-Prymnesium_polylepis.1
MTGCPHPNDISARRVLMLHEHLTSLGQGSRECGLCPADSVRPWWIGPWTRVEFLAQKSGHQRPSK